MKIPSNFCIKNIIVKFDTHFNVWPTVKFYLVNNNVMLNNILGRRIA